MLAVRKYLDALCVCAWALTSTLFAVTTFGLMVWLGQPLKPSTVIVCLSLFNILIAPLNALPWVLNGILEAIVSARRVAAVLSAGGGTGDSPSLMRNKPTAVSHTRIQVGTPQLLHEAAAPFQSFGWDSVIQEVHSVPLPPERMAAAASRTAAEPAVQMKGASFSWARGLGTPASYVLQNLCFSVPKVR